MENNKTTVHYVMVHSKMPEIIFKNYTEFLKIATQGQTALCSFLELTWNNIKKDLLEKTEYQVLDKDQRIDLYSFQISIINTSKNKKFLNITMPPISQYTESRFITILFEQHPKYFTCELSKSFNEKKPEDYYILGEWKHDTKNNKFSHQDHGRVEKFSINNYLNKIEKLC